MSDETDIETTELTITVRVRARVDLRRALHANGDDGEFGFGVPELQGGLMAEIEHYLEGLPYILKVQVDDVDAERRLEERFENERLWRSRGAPPSSIRLVEDDDEATGPLNRFADVELLPGVDTRDDGVGTELDMDRDVGGAPFEVTCLSCGRSHSGPCGPAPKAGR